jgi:hypothetical protein
MPESGFHRSREAPFGGSTVLKRRVGILVGHFGSGKTEIALNMALELATRRQGVVLVDLDIVKPYFRSRSAREFMAGRGVRVVAPDGELAHADLPIVVPEVLRVLQDPACRVLVDAGGDPVGARVLGSLADVMPRGETELLVVLNFRRPSTTSVDEAVAMVGAIEAASRLPAAGLISNTHLLGETTAEVVRRGLEMARETGERLGVPVVGVGCDEATAAALAGEDLGCPIVTLARLIAPPFEPYARRRVGPVFALN